MSKNDAAALLREARDLISDPKRWTQGALARSAKGRAVSPHSTHATSWCAFGAVEKYRNRYPGSSLIAMCCLSAVASNHPSRSGQILNDSGNHADVMSMFDRAILRAENIP